MLKTFEEPLPGRLIIGTTTSRDALLDTIVSRAFIIRFLTPTYEDYQHLDKFLPPEKLEIFNKYKNLFFSLSQLKPGIIFDMLDKWETNRLDYEQMYENFEKFINVYEKNLDLWDKYSILKQINEKGWLDKWRNFMIYYFDQKKQFDQVKKLIDFKQKKDANLNIENLIFEYSL
jgi:hypothetical protein